jgi:hypothetical protein
MITFGVFQFLVIRIGIVCIKNKTKSMLMSQQSFSNAQNKKEKFPACIKHFFPSIEKRNETLKLLAPKFFIHLGGEVWKGIFMRQHFLQ